MPQHINYQKHLYITPLPYTFKNTTQLIQAVKQTPVLPTHIFTSLDRSNMYSNIPALEIRHIFNITEFNVLPSHTNQELVTWYDTIMKQNYFTNKNNMIFQNDRLYFINYNLM